MYRYFVNRNAQANGDHEVHMEDCSFIPNSESRIDLGLHENCKSAVEKAKILYKHADGCYYCTEECHKN